MGVNLHEIRCLICYFVERDLHGLDTFRLSELAKCQGAIYLGYIMSSVGATMWGAQAQGFDDIAGPWCMLVS